MLNSSLKSSSLEWNAFTEIVSPQPPASGHRGAFPMTSQSLGGPGATGSAAAALDADVWSWWEPRWRVEWGPSTLGNFKLGEKTEQKYWVAIVRANLLLFPPLQAPGNILDDWGQNWPICFVNFGGKWEDQGLSSSGHHVPLYTCSFLLQMVL